MFLAIIALLFVVLSFLVVEYSVPAANQSASLAEGTSQGSGLHELALQFINTAQGDNMAIIYIGLGVTFGVLLTIDAAIKRFV